MKDWQKNKHVLYHHTTSDSISSILKNGIMSRWVRWKRGETSRGVSSLLYHASLQDIEDISFISAGGDYLDFINQRKLTREIVERMTEKKFEDIYVSINGYSNSNGVRLSDFYNDTAEKMRDTLLRVLRGEDSFLNYLYFEIEAHAGESAVFVVDTKKERRIFPHRYMHPFEVCIREIINPSEIIDVVTIDNVGEYER